MSLKSDLTKIVDDYSLYVSLSWNPETIDDFEELEPINKEDELVNDLVDTVAKFIDEKLSEED